MPIKPLKHYSLTTPASVYDEEALTALELAGRTAAKVNEAAEAFNNLEEETNKHLVEQDNAIQKMNDEAMPKAVRETVNQHIENGDFDDQIDESLGNLKERVDNLTKTVPVGGTSGDAELLDIRVLSDGTVAPNAGEATRQIDAAVRKYTPIVSANLFNPAAIKKGRTVGNTIDGDTEWETRDISEPIEIDIVYEITVYMNCKIESIIFYDDTGARIGGYMFEQFTAVSGGYMIHYPAGKKIKYFIVQWRNEKAPDSEFYNEAENIMVSLSPISGFLPYGYDKPAYKGKVIITDDAIPDMTEGKTSLFIGANTGAHNDESEENDDGRYNTAVGVRAMQQNTTGDHNTGVGFQSMMKNTTGNYNTGFGEDTLFENTTGEHNTAVGIRAMQNNTTGTRNTVVGGGSGLNMVDGNNNTVVGQNAGNTITTEDGNTLVGQWTDIEEGVENSIAIGKSAKATASNQTVIGTPNTTEVIVHGLKQDTGDDKNKIMSQAAVTAKLDYLTKNTAALDSKDAELIPANSNADTYTTPGNYKVYNTADAETIANLPENIPGRLTVYESYMTNRLQQTFVTSTSVPRLYIRSYNGSVWYDWEKILTESNAAEMLKNSIVSSNITITKNNYTEYFTDFNDIPVNTVYSITQDVPLLNSPPGNNMIDLAGETSGYMAGTVLTCSGNSVSVRSRFQIFMGQTSAQEQSIMCFRSGYPSDGVIKWYPWQTFSDRKALTATNIAVRKEIAQEVLPSMDDAEINTIYQIDLDCDEGTILNHPNPGQSCVLITFGFSHTSRHGMVQMCFGIGGATKMFYRYGYKQSGTEYRWTGWEKVLTESSGTSNYLVNMGRLPDGSDLNNITGNTIYLVGDNAGNQNVPTEKAGFITSKNVNNITLHTFEALTGERYSRYAVADEWHEWVEG